LSKEYEYFFDSLLESEHEVKRNAGQKARKTRKKNGEKVGNFLILIIFGGSELRGLTWFIPIENGSQGTNES
jgi:hypothetical protein